MLPLAAQGKPIRVVNDQVVARTYTADLAPIRWESLQLNDMAEWQDAPSRYLAERRGATSKQPVRAQGLNRAHIVGLSPFTTIDDTLNRAPRLESSRTIRIAAGAQSCGARPESRRRLRTVL